MSLINFVVLTKGCEFLKKRKFLEKKDIIIVLVLLLIAVAALLIYNLKYSSAKSARSQSSTESSAVLSSAETSSESSANAQSSTDQEGTIEDIDDSDLVYAETYSNNELIYKIGLNKDRTITIPDKPEIELAVEDGKIGFTHSDCPDQICVHTGFLDKPGYVAACLPNSVVIVISENPVNQAESGVDTTS